jgi:hypothetical protein
MRYSRSESSYGTKRFQATTDKDYRLDGSVLGDLSGRAYPGATG